MTRLRGIPAISAFVLFMPVLLSAQSAPPKAAQPWVQPPGIDLTLPPASASDFHPDASKVYRLSELVDIAESNNPETRVAWANAKAQAASLGIAKSSLYPTLAAETIAQNNRSQIFFAPAYVRQTISSFVPAFSLDYVIFDFGRREDEIEIQRNNLLASNLHFNDTHRSVIFHVMQAYYGLLNAKGEEDAAEANLKNATTVRENAEARLRLGLATLPDELEARSAEAQADYDLQSAKGQTEIAQGDLAEALGISPTKPVQVQNIEDLKLPDDIQEAVDKAIDRALAQRPDLLQKVAQLRAANAEVKGAHSAYLPVLSLDGDAGYWRSYGEQDQLPGIYSRTREIWNVQLSLTWTLFDGWARKQRVAQARADQKRAAAEIDAIRNQVENEVWAAYSRARTAQRQQAAAAALLTAAQESYNAALESYKYGVRSQIDVVSAQRTLAQARTAEVTARTQLFTSIASLAFETGDLLNTKRP